MTHPTDTVREPLQLGNPTLLRDRCPLGGEWVEAESGERAPVTNPATGRVIATVPRLGAVHIRRALAAAGAAFPTWAAKPVRERATMLHRWATLILANLEDLAYFVTVEQGKPLAAAMAEIALAASGVRRFADAAKRVYAERVPSPQSDRRRLILLHPVGVCAAITSWRFPSSMVAWKAAPALAAGCTVVLNPAPQTPLSALALAALAEEAGVPRGVLNMVVGPTGPIASELAASAQLRKLTFGGAPEIGERLRRGRPDAAGKIAVERGGKAVLLIFEDADVEHAVHGALRSTFWSAGQPGVRANRLLIQRGIYDAFATRYVEEVGAQGLKRFKAFGLGPKVRSRTVGRPVRTFGRFLPAGTEIRERATCILRIAKPYSTHSHSRPRCVRTCLAPVDTRPVDRRSIPAAAGCKTSVQHAMTPEATVRAASRSRLRES